MTADLNAELILYRRQFVLGPRPWERFPSWKQISIGQNVWLTAHPDLNLQQVVSGGRSLTLLGYILDFRDPKADDRAILERLFPKLCSDGDPKASLQSANELGGRWILIVDDGQRITLFNDPLGQRQIYYTRRSMGGETWCASQPGVLADILKLTPSQEAIDFVETQKTAGQAEYWFPNDHSLFAEIKMVVPNHYLDLTRAQCHRFWPLQRLPRLALNRAAEEGARMISGLMMSAGFRFPLRVLITAGWDSRVVLAAAKEVKTEVSYFTFVPSNAPLENPDVSVPAKLLPSLGKTHRILHIPSEVDSIFEQLYRQNVSAAHVCWAPIAQVLYEDDLLSGLRVSGSGSETVRQQFRPRVYGVVTAEVLSRFANARQELALDAFSDWLSEVPANLGFDALDLFYWEQKCGQWLAVGQVEWDIAGESFTPFNCRSLLTTLLATHIDYRLGPQYELYRTMLRKLWPDVLTEPINPHKKSEKPSFKARLKHELVRSHLREYIPNFLFGLARRVIR